MTTFLKIERGNPTDEELAALTTVLLAVIAGAGPTPTPAPGPASVQWLRPERRPAFVVPHSWAA
ncbi:acyl-CoA carboxylase subunit epsilon [Nocardia sp. NPDC005998]|uniref:acyl-CoA carboxylase subunit epsilon n=1 Tax=Nocardia sp. NPDC005998 TaxID=3156894 RepID=UPI0033B57016